MDVQWLWRSWLFADGVTQRGLGECEGAAARLAASCRLAALPGVQVVVMSKATRSPRWTCQGCGARRRSSSRERYAGVGELPTGWRRRGDGLPLCSGCVAREPEAAVPDRQFALAVDRRSEYGIRLAEAAARLDAAGRPQLLLELQDELLPFLAGRHPKWTAEILERVSGRVAHVGLALGARRKVARVARELGVSRQQVYDDHDEFEAWIARGGFHVHHPFAEPGGPLDTFHSRP